MCRRFVRNTAHSNGHADNMGPVLRTASTSYIKATESTCATYLRKLATGSLQATFNQPTTNLQPWNSSTMAQGPVLAFSISYADLCRTLNSVEATVRWCQEKRLLPTERECVCGTECHIVKRSRYPERIFVFVAQERIVRK